MSYIQSAEKLTSNSSRRTSDDLPFPLATTRNLEPGARISSPAGRAAQKPFASFAPATSAFGDDTSAETKHYEVPRELIEIARAKLGTQTQAGTLTPIAPRPTPELDAALRVYAASVSKVDAAVVDSQGLVDVAPRQALANVASSDAAPVIVVGAPLTVSDPGPASTVRGDSLERPDFRPGIRWRAWLLGAGLSLTVYYGMQLLSGALP